ncbi:hydroxyacylglutathione hydrolase [Brevundimonas sp. EAKA]|jgi:hydroxyacylglutathione hydrolase|uniref:Hydroxyacylglutathione hydrolase n=1 Tax=Brevundimonas mediterranea TaxID=74329 RepID=A0AB37E9A0_9CAUL|nr:MULTISPECIES: hydroxyacylglutathione hydrolase [Brevundimonas]OYX79899.1 MAG: hydroxyacylglutathione hydrolase [Brevundimonas sp. 32-68-21]EDX79875.1 metallo-beta-lactamase superfamily protein [Brevundimonas sp. BAL3]KDP93194.1 hydroxyacylglutathione hydrolase [Brevundimonas sp. EAKA]MBA4330898.1 hydroxyacylglutathione hydrolase [Brevundimonas sp.]MBJ7319524.1 hydroxyacylglutathione hydrolase [Brevundimonas sp.]
MTLDVHLFPCRSDNYGFLIRDTATGVVAAVDTPDAERILQELEALGWGRLDLILNTHWHPDHTEGNERLKAETGCEIVGPEEVRRVAPLDRVVADGDVVMVGETRFEVTATPGHTLGHVVFRSVENQLAFVGDTLFALGCGRLFEGTPEQMWASLQALAAWPEATVIWCAHEYTASNARFTLTLDDRPETRAHAEAIFAARARGEPTVPTTIGTERRFNPFLTAVDAAQFAARRAAKDGFSG